MTHLQGIIMGNDSNFVSTRKPHEKIDNSPNALTPPPSSSKGSSNMKSKSIQRDTSSIGSSSTTETRLSVIERSYMSIQNEFTKLQEEQVNSTNAVLDILQVMQIPGVKDEK